MGNARGIYPRERLLIGDNSVRFHSKRFVAFAAATSLVIAACGGGDEAEDVPADEPAAADESAAADAPAAEPAPAPDEVSGTLIGAGASSQAAAMLG
ncbi:MAG: hypothetical protein ACO4CE_03115, partial [Ilumatobacteraceae bacterium]